MANICFSFLKKNLKVNISCGCQSHSPYFSLANVKYPWLTEFTNFDNSSQQFFPTFYLCLQQVTYSVWELILPWSRKWFSWKPNISLLSVNKPYSINLISFTLLVPKPFTRFSISYQVEGLLHGVIGQQF